jgi:putative transposase
VKEVMPQLSLRRICRLLDVTRSTVYDAQAADAPAGENKLLPHVSQDQLLLARIKALIEEFPTFGYRRICALLHKREKLRVNRKKVYRLMREQRWMVTQRQVSPKWCIRQVEIH